MPKPTTVYGIVSFGGHLVRGMVRIVLTTEEPMNILENDKLYYGEDVKGRVTKTKVLTMSELTEKFEKEFATHKTNIPNMYKLNSSESVKILKTVFDVKTCKKLSFSKDSDDDSEDNESTEEHVPVAKTTKGKKASAPVEEQEPDVKTTKGKKASAPVEEQESVKTTKGKKAPAPVEEQEPVVKTTKGKKASAPVEEQEPVKTTKGKSKVVEVSAKKPELSDSKKTTTSKVKESKVRIPLSDSEDDEHALDSDNDELDS
jgi:hypothetical protein